jgi:hypothetical protein
MQRSCDSVSPVVEEEKHGSERIHSCLSFLGEARARWSAHALRKGMNGPHLAVGVLEKTNTRLASRALSWERAHTSGGFPYGYAHKAVARALRRGLVTRAEAPEIALYLVQHGRVFTASPALANPYPIRLFKVLSIYSHRGGYKWNC